MKKVLTPASGRGVSERLEAVMDWRRIAEDVNCVGAARVESLLTAEECSGIAALYQQEDRFRSRIVMQRHGFGSGEYQYFSYPLPELVAGLRGRLYPHLARIANQWNEALGTEMRFPASHADYIERCHAAGQKRPTPLILQYGKGDYNCLHQDLYGELVFPLQVAILLSRPGRDFKGGEFVLTEQRPRRQSRPEVVSLQQGDAVIFAVHQRPVKGERGYYRVQHRHGVSRLHEGRRHMLGIIFHDAG